MIMNVKYIMLCAALSFITVVGVKAQEVKTDSIIGKQDSLEFTVDSLAIETDSVAPVSDAKKEKVSDEELEKHWEEVWGQSKFFNIAYAKQTLKSDHEKMNSNLAFSVQSGRTYYLHKKPIAGLLKFGIDVNFMDMSFAKYPDLPADPAATAEEDEDSPLIDLGIMQLEYGIGVGPSVTVNPVDHLKASVFFHVTPSYSMMLQNSSLYHHYATFFNVGLSVAYRVISLGVEYRWCGKVDYDGLTMDRLDEIDDENGDFQNPFESVGALMKTNTWRFFVGFRF